MDPRNGVPVEEVARVHPPIPSLPGSLGVIATCLGIALAALVPSISFGVPPTDPLRERVRTADVIILATTRFVLPPTLTGEAQSVVGLEVDSLLAGTGGSRGRKLLTRGSTIRVRPDALWPSASALTAGQWIWFLQSGDSSFRTLRAHPIPAPRVSREATVLLDSLGEERPRQRAPLRSAFMAFLQGEEDRLPSGGVIFMNVAPK